MWLSRGRWPGSLRGMRSILPHRRNGRSPPLHGVQARVGDGAPVVGLMRVLPRGGVRARRGRGRQAAPPPAL
eukprot:6218137-Lingulodinium_polyedra.AAC.1